MRIGDQVSLKSGGPALTVAKITGDEVLCFWFESGDSFRQQAFPAATLVNSVEDFDVPVEEPVQPPVPDLALLKFPVEGEPSMGRILADSMETQRKAARHKIADESCE